MVCIRYNIRMVEDHKYKMIQKNKLFEDNRKLNEKLYDYDERLKKIEHDFAVIKNVVTSIKQKWEEKQVKLNDTDKR